MTKCLQLLSADFAGDFMEYMQASEGGSAEEIEQENKYKIEDLMAYKEVNFLSRFSWYK